MAARRGLKPQILSVPNESVKQVVGDSLDGVETTNLSDEEKEVHKIHENIKRLGPPLNEKNSLGMTYLDSVSLYPGDRRWSTVTWEAAFQVLPSTRPYKLGFVKYPDTIIDCLDTEFFDITIIELSNGSKCSLSVVEHSALFALCSETELSDEDGDYVFSIMKARMHEVLQGGRCWQKKLDMPKFKCANSSYSLLMFNFIAGHMCLWGCTADWTMLHVTTKMLAIKKGEDGVVPPTPLDLVNFTIDKD